MLQLVEQIVTISYMRPTGGPTGGPTYAILIKLLYHSFCVTFGPVSVTVGAYCNIFLSVTIDQ